MRSGSLFSGYGGLDMAVAEVFGAELAWFSEIDDAPSKILAHHWPEVPNLGDITKVDWDAVEPVDILGGGFPCQDVSAAGKRAGIRPGNRSGLWNHMAYAISKLRPRFVVVENVRGLLSAEAHSDVEPCPWCLGDGPGEPALRALGAVLGDLADLGYDARWCGLRAADVGAPHGRYRIFILARDTHCGDRGRWATSGLERQEGPSVGPVTHPRRLGGPGRGIVRDLGCASADGEGEASERQRDRNAAHDRGATSTYADDTRCQQHGRVVAVRAELTAAECRGDSAANTARDGRIEGRPEPAGEFGGSDAPERGPRLAAWGQYARAISRWERSLGRVAPDPTEPNSKGNPRLSPRFVEWMMGLPVGHVTAVPGMPRNAQLKALGNGVVPQQAIAALRHMTRGLEAAA